MPDPQIRELAPAVRSVVTGLRHRFAIPAISVGILRDQELVWTEGFGYADLDTREPVNEKTLYRVASITKTVTAAALFQLRERGLVSLDDPLVLHLPEFSGVMNRHGPLEDVTIRRVLAHYAGIVSEAPFEYWDTLDFPDMGKILDHLGNTYVAIRPDSQWKYSNLGFALLGEIVARLSGQSYYQYVKEQVLAPLGMKRSTFCREAAEEGQLATGYSPTLYSEEVIASPHPPLAGLDAAGGLYSNVADLARWIAVQYKEPGEDGQVGAPLSSSAIAEMHRVHYLNDDWRAAQCLPWRAERSGENVYLGHGGSLPGFRTKIGFNVAHKVGVVFLTNKGGHPAPDLAVTQILDLILEKEGSRSRSHSAPEFAPVPEAYRPLLGAYASYQAALTNVVWRGGALRLEQGSSQSTSLFAPAVLRATDDPLTFTVNGGRGAGEPIRFVIGESGLAERFHLGGSVARRV